MKLPSHLLEAQRLLDAGLKLIPLKKNTKEPHGFDWNNGSNYATEIHPKATGYGIHLVANGLCSVDPDNVEMAEKGLAALGFNLEDIMNAGVRTCSSRPGSGGRSTFKATPDLRWIRFAAKGVGIALEFRAHSDNLQDCVPGVKYLDKAGNECTQDYDPFSAATFDAAPELPADLLAWWTRMSEDDAFYIEQETLFFAALGIEWDRTNTHGKQLYGSSPMRISYNQSHKVEDLLRKHGYVEHGVDRWSAPEATGSPGIRPIKNKIDLWQSDHGSDVLNGTFDAWTAYVLLEHGGDVDAAERAEGESVLDMFEAEDEAGALVSGFEALESEARRVDGRDAFKAFAEKVSAVRMEVLNATDRTMLAGIIASAKVLDGMTKANIAAALKFTPKRIADHRDRPKYERNEEGEIMTTTGNITLALQSPSEMGISIAHDDFTDDLKFSKDGGETWELFSDQHYVGVLIRLEQLGIYGVSTQKVRECVYSVAVANTIDTAQVWLSGLEWDGVKRIDGFFVNYFGAEDSAYVREVGRYIWSALAGRVLVPGVQADMVPVLVGKQGVRKSTGIVAMAPGREFFSEFIFGENETESARKMRGCLVGELAELRGLRSKEKEHIKAWLTRTHEEVRKLYKEFTTVFARRHMFIGSTNDEKFLDEDPSGQRRWLPIRVGMGDVEAISRDRDQLWAEGRELFTENEGIWYAAAELLAREVHGDFIEADSWEGLITEWLDDLESGGGLPEWITTDQICDHAIDVPKSGRHSGVARRVGGILRKLGWETKVKRIGEKHNVKNVWVKG
jgi:hypothetical protein